MNNEKPQSSGMEEVVEAFKDQSPEEKEATLARLREDEPQTTARPDLRRGWLDFVTEGPADLYGDFATDAVDEMLGDKLKDLSDEHRELVCEATHIAATVVCKVMAVPDSWDDDYLAATAHLRETYAQHDKVDSG